MKFSLAREHSNQPNNIPTFSWRIVAACGRAAIGIFPNAGQPFYDIGLPLFRRTPIRLQHGRSFIIEAPGSSATNLYVQVAELDGHPLDRAWLTHDEVASGGRLVLHMGPRPSA